MVYHLSNTDIINHIQIKFPQIISLFAQQLTHKYIKTNVQITESDIYKNIFIVLAHIGQENVSDEMFMILKTIHHIDKKNEEFYYDIFTEYTEKHYKLIRDIILNFCKLYAFS